MQGCLFTPSGECSSALHVSPKVSSEEAANPRMVQGTQEATVELPQRNAALHRERAHLIDDNNNVPATGSQSPFYEA